MSDIAALAKQLDQMSINKDTIEMPTAVDNKPADDITTGIITTVNKPSELENIPSDVLPRVFMDSIFALFLSPEADILSALNRLEFDHLQRIKQEVSTRAVSAFPSLGERKWITRKKIGTLAKDIYMLGYSIVDGALHADVEKLYSKSEPPISQNDTMIVSTEKTVANESDALGQGVPKPPKEKSTEELVQLILALTLRVSTLENQVHVVSDLQATVQDLSQVTRH